MKIHCSSRTTAQATLQFSSADCAINGTIRGPYCKYSRTLPCTLPVKDGRAVVVDPCYWTPKLPFRYELKLEVETATGKETHEFLWGIRHCIPHKTLLRMDGKGYVVRAVEPPTDAIDLQELRDLSSGLLTQKRLDDRIYEDASEIGVAVVHVMPNEVSEEATCIERQESLERFPAIVGIGTTMETSVDRRSDVLSIASLGSTGADAANIVLANEADVATIASGETTRPVFVKRVIDSASAADMRQACDKLQRDLAKHGQFAGYIVSHADV